MAAAGAIIGAVGQVFGIIGGLKTAKAEKKMEKLRERQMGLEAMRKKRENLRQGLIAQAEVTAGAVGAGAEDSSALSGGIAGIKGSVNRNNLAVSQDETIGHSMFRQNAKAAAGRGLASIGQGISSLGGAVGGMGGGSLFGTVG